MDTLQVLVRGVRECFSLILIQSYHSLHSRTLFHQTYSRSNNSLVSLCLVAYSFAREPLEHEY